MITQDSCAHLKLPSSTWVGALFPVKELKNILLLYPLKRNQDSALSLHYFCFLTTFPSFLHFPTSLVSNCLHQLFGKREGLQTGNRKTFVPVGSSRVLPFQAHNLHNLPSPTHQAHLLKSHFVLLIVVTYSSRNMSYTFQPLKLLSYLLSLGDNLSFVYIPVQSHGL